MKLRTWIASSLLLLTVLGIAAALTAWKLADQRQADAAAQNQPEPTETVTAAVAGRRDFRRSTTAIGTVVALRSITLRNELPGTVHQVMLEPGQVVEQGTLLVALDVAVEQAELQAQEAQAKLAEALLRRMEQASRDHAASEIEVERAKAERDVALAQIARTQAVIDRKTIKAPFRARVGISDVHVGQYLNEGTELTTLQGVDDAVYVDFMVTQKVSAGLRPDDQVQVLTTQDPTPVTARIVAVDARVDPHTRNAMVRGRIEGHHQEPGADGNGSAALRLAPGAAVRVLVPVGPQLDVVTVPVGALRKGPAGSHVFVLAPDQEGKTRAQLRPVQSGAMLGDEVVIHQGLKAGEQVAASGSFKLREGVLVAIADGSGTQTR